MVVKDKKIFVLAAAVLIVKFALLPLAQNADSDAACRTWLGLAWLQHPEWLTHSVWGPFHFYMTGAALAIWNNPVYAPVALNILLSVVMLFPFYYFVKREFSPDGAFAAACLLAASPIIFRNSLMNMSEPPYLLLLVVVLNFLSRGFHGKASGNFVFAGLFATIGAGIRFEFWIFIALMAVIILVKAGIKHTLLFLAVAMLYPLSVLLTHFITDNYSLKGMFREYPWSLHVDQPPPHLTDYLRRIWFYPLCLLISLGPFVFIAIARIIRTLKLRLGAAWCGSLFVVFYLITAINALYGTIFLHARFVSTISVLGIPFIAPWFAEMTALKKRLAILFVLLTAALSYVYNVGNITPLPRLSNQTAVQVSGIVNHNLPPGGGLIVDFWEWENTYYVALQTKLGLDNLCVQEGNVLDSTRRAAINSIIGRHKQGIILLVKKSLLWQNSAISDSTLKFKFGNQLLNTQLLFDNEQIKVWRYRYN